MSMANPLASYTRTYLNGDDRIRAISVDPYAYENGQRPVAVSGSTYVASEGIAFVMGQIAKGLQPYFLCTERGILINVTEESIPADGVIVEWLRPEIADSLNREYSAIKIAKLEIADHELAIAAIKERGTSKLF